MEETWSSCCTYVLSVFLLFSGHQTVVKLSWAFGVHQCAWGLWSHQVYRWQLHGEQGQDKLLLWNRRLTRFLVIFVFGSIFLCLLFMKVKDHTFWTWNQETVVWLRARLRRSLMSLSKWTVRTAWTCSIVSSYTFLSHIVHIFLSASGKLAPASAFMTGKVKMTGDLTKAFTLEKVMKAARQAAEAKAKE